MNRLNQLKLDRWKRMFYVCCFDDICSKEEHEHWKREYETYQVICQCIRRGYVPVKEVE